MYLPHSPLRLTLRKVSPELGRDSMKSKIAGVALAAMMVCGLGGVQRANAGVIRDIGVVLDSKAVSYRYEDNKSPSLTYSNISNINFDAYYLTNYIPIQYGFSIRELINDNYFSSDFHLSVDAMPIVTGRDLIITGSSGDGASFSLSLRGFSYSPVRSTALSANLAFHDSRFDLSLFENSPEITLSAVPLPASVSLFGLALLALGGVGYASSRSASRVA